MTVAWIAEHVRFTAFLSEPSAPPAVDWWERVVGAAPIDSVSAQAGSLRVDSGPFDAGHLELERSAERIEWRLVPRMSDEPLGLLNVGDWEISRGRFLANVVEKWLALEDLPTFSRLAFGTILLQPVGSPEAGYVAVNALLPTVDIDPGALDFLFQVNRRRESSAAPGVAINRLSRWSVGRAGHIMLSLGGAAARTERDLGYHVRLQLDVNTVPVEGTPVSSASRIALSKELVELADEISRDGDVA